MAKIKKIKKGDLVHVLSGKDRTKQGKVIAVDTETQPVSYTHLTVPTNREV